jgi:Trk K+ transport system NAD-binding subunit
MLRVGATTVYTPSHALAAALAAHASARIGPPADGLQSLDEQAGLAEYRVHPENPLAGKQLGELHLRERLGLSLIGQWQGRSFVPSRRPDTRIASGAILVAIGSKEGLAQLDALAAPIPRTGPIVVAGFGEVGRKVDEMLKDAGETTIAIDARSQPEVDVVGDFLEQSTLERAEVRSAGTVVLALRDDSAGVFATAVVRGYAPQTRLIARVNRANSVQRLYRAGADFALSIGQVAGQLLAHRLFGENALSVDRRLRCMRMTPETLVGLHPWRAAVRERSGASLLGLQRGGKALVPFPPDFRIEPEDQVVVCGTAASIDELARAFAATPP